MHEDIIDDSDLYEVPAPMSTNEASMGGMDDALVFDDEEPSATVNTRIAPSSNSVQSSWGAAVEEKVVWIHMFVPYILLYNSDYYPRDTEGPESPERGTSPASTNPATGGVETNPRINDRASDTRAWRE